MIHNVITSGTEIAVQAWKINVALSCIDHLQYKIKGEVYAVTLITVIFSGHTHVTSSASL